jgi:DNA-binding MarR family transcriptional regulator
MVDRLVEKGILTREHSVEDRRKVVVRVSPEAMEDIESVEETILRSFAELVEKIGPEITRKWCQVLERVKSVIQND